MKGIIVSSYNKQYEDLVYRYLKTHMQLNDKASMDIIKRMNQDNSYLVIEAETIFCLCQMEIGIHETRGRTLDLNISFAQQSDKKEMLSLLYPVIERVILDHQSQYIVLSCDENDRDNLDFWLLKGFKKWFVLRSMIHDDRELTYHQLIYRNYEDSDFDVYFRELGYAFEPMRQAMDITPYNVSDVSDKKRINEKHSLEKEKDHLYMFFDNNVFVGSSLIKDSEIDDLFVIKSYQGLGYGRKIIEDSIRLAKQKTNQPIHLSVVDWNDKAKRLYQSVGFTFTTTKIFLRKQVL